MTPGSRPKLQVGMPRGAMRRTVGVRCMSTREPANFASLTRNGGLRRATLHSEGENARLNPPCRCPRVMLHNVRSRGLRKLLLPSRKLRRVRSVDKSSQPESSRRAFSQECKNALEKIPIYSGKQKRARAGNIHLCVHVIVASFPSAFGQATLRSGRPV